MGATADEGTTAGFVEGRLAFQFCARCAIKEQNMNVIEKIQAEQLRTDIVPFKVGDTIKVYSRIKEADRERVQMFSGIVINKQGRGIAETFTVRRISYGEGVERIFPLHSPFIQKIEVERAGNVHRAKLYYLRKRIGKTATKVAEA
jgi:large subunit ribosomal protein L19